MYRLLYFFFLFLGACSPKIAVLQRQWINLDCYQNESPLVLDFRDKRQVFMYDSQFQRQTGEYSQKNNLLFLKNAEQNLAQDFQIQFLSRDSLVLLSPNPTSQPAVYVSSEQQFRSQRAFKRYLRTWEGRETGIEKTLFSLLPPLQAPTVEQRVWNLQSAIGEGEYISTPTIFLLMNLPPEAAVDERPDTSQQRQLVSKIWRITKHQGVFRLELENQQDINVTLPIYQSRDKNAKPQAVLDLRISATAHAKISPLADGGLKIDIDGVKIGKGWLKVGIPPFVLRENKGEILGFQFSVLR